MTRFVTSRYRYKQRRLVVWGICALIGLAAAEPVLSAENAFDGAYAGKRALTKGPAAQCASSGEVSATIHDGVLTFTNSTLRNFSISFDPHPDGSFSQISTAGASVLIEGRIVGNVLDADVTNGACEHRWHMTKTSQ
jgi:hypothetical protein